MVAFEAVSRQIGMLLDLPEYGSCLISGLDGPSFSEMRLQCILIVGMLEMEKGAFGARTSTSRAIARRISNF